MAYTKRSEGKVLYDIRRIVVDMAPARTDITNIVERSEGSPVNVEQVVEALGALAHEHRLAIYRMLVEAGPAGLSAGAIAERLGVPPSSLTFHTLGLVRAGLATQRRVSRQLIYSADYAAMNGLIGYLTENCCGSDSACGSPCNPAQALAKSSRPSKRKTA